MEWINKHYGGKLDRYPRDAERSIADQAAQWGADQELEECCKVLEYQFMPDSIHLRAARRPKPPSLKEQALYLLANHSDRWTTSPHDRDLVRRALEALDD